MKKHPAFQFGVFTFVACALLTVIVACSKKSDKIASGVALDRPAVLSVLIQEGVLINRVELSSLNYGEVNETALGGMVDAFKSDLSRKGVPISDVSGKTGYDRRFQCTGFSDFFAGSAAAQMMGELWHSPLNVNRPAVFVVWYSPDSSPRDANGNSLMDHAINLVIVNGRRAVWIEPQTGRRVILTATEKLSARIRARRRRRVRL
jgi:hypothetical protein